MPCGCSTGRAWPRLRPRGRCGASGVDGTRSARYSAAVAVKRPWGSSKLARARAESDARFAEVVTEALRAEGGNVRATARRLGVVYSALYSACRVAKFPLTEAAQAARIAAGTQGFQEST